MSPCHLVINQEFTTISHHPAAPAQPLDKITVADHRNYLITVAEEMKKVIERTSMSPIIYEVLDFSTGVAFSFDSKRLPNVIAYVEKPKQHHAQNGAEL